MEHTNLNFQFKKKDFSGSSKRILLYYNFYYPVIIK